MARSEYTLATMMSAGADRESASSATRQKLRRMGLTLEQIEKLEQLRVLEAGYPIAIDVTEDPTIGVDTPEDAKKFEAHLG